MWLRNAASLLAVATVLASATAAADAPPPPAPSPWLNAPDHVPLRLRPAPTLAGTWRDDRYADLATRDAAATTLAARPRPHPLRATLMASTMIGLGAAWYWIDRDRQVADWDYPSIGDRLTFEAWRYDNNPFPINFAWHALDGGQYHVVARANDLGLPASIGVGVATSLAWEFLLEFREKVSINDAIFTTGAGTALGELVHWLGRYLESAPAPRRWHPVARWILSPLRATSVAWDRRSPTRAGTSADALGLSSDIWHRFTLRAGAGGGQLTTTGTSHAGVTSPASLPVAATASAEAELAALPGYLSIGSWRRAFSDGNLTRGQVRLTAGDDTLGLAMGAEVVLAGVHQQAISATGGRAVTLGVALGYAYRKDAVGPWRDRTSLLHLPGPALDLHARRGSLAARVRLRASADFAGLHAAAYPAWQAAHPDLVAKTILRKHGYYYAWGGAASIDAEVELPPVRAGAALAVGTYRSADGYDKQQEDITFDVMASERQLDTALWLRVRPGPRAFVEARAAHAIRDGWVGELSSTRTATTLELSLGAEL
jgi:hypothetical protein